MFVCVLRRITRLQEEEVKKFLQFTSWVERATEFDSMAAMRSYAVMLIAFVAGLALTYFAAFVWQPVALIAVFGSLIAATLMLPYTYGLTWRIGQFRAANGSWLALLSALI